MKNALLHKKVNLECVVLISICTLYEDNNHQGKTNI